MENRVSLFGACGKTAYIFKREENGDRTCTGEISEKFACGLWFQLSLFRVVKCPVTINIVSNFKKHRTGRLDRYIRERNSVVNQICPVK